MGEHGGVRSRAAQLDGVAEAYEKHRPAYPADLVGEACLVAGVGIGGRVLEVGCGPGQLTSTLVDRGLRVVAVEPGAKMIDRARHRAGVGEVRFLHDRFEDAQLGDEPFDGVFSATAFHWVDPAVSWAKAASVIKPGGALILLTHCSGATPDSIDVERALFASLKSIAPEVAVSLPRPREASDVLEGAQQRCGNVSELWSWIGQFNIAVPEAADLYGDVRVLSVSVTFNWTAERLNAQRRTTSMSFRLGPERLAALEADTHQIIEGLGGEISLPTLVVAAVAPCL